MCSILRDMSSFPQAPLALHSNAEHRNDYRISHRRPLTRRDRRRSPHRQCADGNRQRPAQPATASRRADSKLAAAIDEAVKGLDSVPRLKKLSPEKKKQLVEFVIGNTLFVLTHELGHGLINEMNMPVLGREEDAANSFAIVTALKMGPAFSERRADRGCEGSGSQQQTRQERRERARIL